MAYHNPSDFVVANFFKDPNEIEIPNDRETLETLAFLDEIGYDLEDTHAHYERVFRRPDAERFFD